MACAVRLALALLLLGAAVSVQAGTTRSLPRARVLQASTTGCSFNAANQAQTVTAAWLKTSFNWVLASPQGALDCWNKVQIGYDFAYESVNNLAAIIEDVYVFTAIAVDVPGELKKLANSWDKEQSIGLGDLQTQVNDIFNRLRDAHVTYTGNGNRGRGTVLGNVLARMTDTGPNSGSQHAYLVESNSGAFLRGVQVTKNGNSDPVLQGSFYTPKGTTTTVTFKEINGGKPMDYFISLANTFALNLPYHSLGTRINLLLPSFNSILTATLGNVLDLPDADVTLSDGSSIKLRWGITFPTSISASQIAQYQQDANTPGVPLKALLKASDVLANANSEITGLPPQPRPSDIGSDLPGLESRRMLQQGTTPFGAKLTYLYDNSLGSDPYGFYFFQQSVAYLKLTTFGYHPNVQLQWWPQFVAAAQNARAKQLVLDVTGNGGGYVASGIQLTMGLYPNVKYGDFGMRWDRIMGDDAVYAYANGLHPADIGAAMQSLARNGNALQARVQQLNGNAAEFNRLATATHALISALTTLFSTASVDQTQVCFDYYKTGDEVKCDVAWQPKAQQLDRFVTSLTSGKLTTTGLANLIATQLPPLLNIFWPYIGIQGDDNSDPYASPVQRTRGGIERNYTAQFKLMGWGSDTLAQDRYGRLATGTTPPFSKITVVGEGFCGSTCAIFSRAAWFYSLRNPSAPKFKYLTYGGTGNAKDSSATSFDGGNVYDKDLLTASWAYYATLDLLADWAGLPDLRSSASAWSDLLPSFPAFLDSLTPAFTQSEIYSVASLGANSHPLEYYDINPDFYLPVWYWDTGMPNKGQGKDLTAMYTRAASV